MLQLSSSWIKKMMIHFHRVETKLQRNDRNRPAGWISEATRVLRGAACFDVTALTFNAARFRVLHLTLRCWEAPPRRRVELHALLWTVKHFSAAEIGLLLK